MQNDFVVSSGGVMSLPQLLKEKWEQFGEQSVPKYFDKGMKKFTQKLEEFSQLERKLTAEEQKELQFMLEALIEANQGMYSK